MWISHAQSAWIRKNDAVALAAGAAMAEACFHEVTKALQPLLADTRTVEVLARLGLRHVALGRSSRLPENGSAEGLAVLEGVVLAGVVARLLSDGDLVRCLSRHHPGALASL
nr:hypothetical protein [Luteibacter rhizovicinus]